MNLSRHFNVLMASAISVSLATTPLMGVSLAQAQNAPAAEAPGDAGWQKEFEVWRTVSKAGKASDYEMYLRTYPTGKFASVAKKRIEDLNTAKAEDTGKIDAQKTADVAQSDDTQVRSADANGADEKTRDLEMWRQVSKSGKQADYEKYLKAFPKGKFAKVAKTRIDALVAEAKAPAEEQATEVVEQPAQQDVAASQPEDQASQQEQAVVENGDAQKVDQAQAPSGDWEQEYALWKAASDGNTVNEYEAYLKTYPAGKFAAIAQARIVQLAAAEQPVANVDEGDTAQVEQQTNRMNKTAKQNQAFDENQAQNQMDDQGVQPDDQAQMDPNQMDQGQMDPNQMDPNQTDQGQPDDQQQMASNQGDQLRRNDVGQNAQDQNVQFTEGTPDTEDQFLDRSGRHEIQGRLTSLGYDTAGTDGSFGPRTRTAISGWQQDNGAPVTGYLSGDQIAQIRKMSQVVYAQWLAAQPRVVVEEPVVVRPRREKVVVVEERNPALDAAIAVGVLGAVVGGHKMGKMKFRPGKVKLIGKMRFGGCKKKRRC